MGCSFAKNCSAHAFLVKSSAKRRAGIARDLQRLARRRAGIARKRLAASLWIAIFMKQLARRSAGDDCSRYDHRAANEIAAE